MMMKKILNIATSLATICFANLAQGQIKGNQPFNGSSIPASTAFIDASTTNSVNGDNLGKGLIFPRADLTKLTLANQGALYNPGNNPNRFDGMIVYNTAVGTTPETGSGIGKQPVVEGFYYFSNAGSPGNLTGGKWIPIAGTSVSPVVNIDTAETATNTQIAGSQVYARKGTFTTTGTTTAITLPILENNASLYSITIFKKSATGNGAKKVYAKDLYSYDPATGAAVTGSPIISVVYPKDTYDYVMEYLKN